HGVDEGGLAVVDVSDDRDIADRVALLHPFIVPRGAPRSAAVLRARLRRSARCRRGAAEPPRSMGWRATRRDPGPSGIAHAPGAGHSTLRPMGDPRCHHCGRRRARRCHRVGALERMLAVVYLYPRSHDATVPPAPDLPDERKLRILYSVDFWLVALAVVLVLVAWLRLFPWSGPCVYGINC